MALIASHVGKLEPHQNSIFTKILSIKDMNTRKPVSPTSFDTNISGYQLDGNRVYFIDIIQYCHPNEKKIKPFNLTLLTSKAIKPIKGEAEIKGKYDLLRFIFNSTASEKAVNTFMILRASSNEPYLISEPFFNIKIKGKWHKVASALLLFGGGVIFSNIADQLVKIAEGKPASTPVLLIAIIGSVLSTLGLFWLKKTG